MKYRKYVIAFLVLFAIAIGLNYYGRYRIHKDTPHFISLKLEALMTDERLMDSLGGYRSFEHTHNRLDYRQEDTLSYTITIFGKHGKVKYYGFQSKDSQGHWTLTRECLVLNGRLVLPSKYRSRFRLGHQNSFQVDTDTVEQLGLIRIDSLAFAELLKGDELLVYNRGDVDHYFYSYQTPKSRYQAVTVLVNTEYNYSLYYLAYSQSGTLVSRFEVASEGGDGLFSHSSHGYFENDTTYVKVKTETEFSEEGDRVNVDTVRNRLVVGRDGTLRGSAPANYP